MSWNTEPTVRVYTEEEKLSFLTKESHWTCSYNEPERWIKDFTECHYTLIGTYEIDEHRYLMRFELDELHREKLAANSSHFHNVIIDKRAKPFSPPYNVSAKR